MKGFVSRHKNYLMKYLTALHFPSLSNVNVTVSTADCFFSNDEMKRMTTYFPSGAPARLANSSARITSRLIT